MTRTRTPFLLMFLAVAACRAAAPPPPASDREWWSDVQTLASDDMQGRKTGTEGYRKAADYVAKQFAALGLQPAGTDGYLQPIAFESRTLVEDRSFLELRRDGKVIPIAFGTQAIARPLGSPGNVDAELVFAGYGLTIPDFHYDDFANVDASGKIVVLLQGAPVGVPSTVAAHYSSTEEATRNLTAHGAIGALLIGNPRLVEIPWDRMASMRSQFGQTMDLAEPGLTIGGTLRVFAFINSEQATMFFGGSGIDLGRVLEADAAKQPLPHGPLNGRLQGRIAYEQSTVRAPNVIAMLPGGDAALKNQYVLLSAHLDHTGVGEPVNGDAIYNGAMDNAAGVASLLEVARVIHARGDRPKRSILFLACTGEEEGELGSKYYANRPTVPIRNVVADINLDMYLPIIPMRIVRGYGIRESDLADAIEAAAKGLGIAVQDDPNPEHNSFIRSDQYSFIKKGVPSLFVAVGYEPKSPDDAIMTNWLATRYHAPSDDVSQPVNHDTAARFNALMVNLSLQVANAERRPQWKPDSFFRRFSGDATTDRR